ncbi:Uncharacterised protein [uncultured archaeon]|nr:Uncharacterised protein [uncultured archaeon]
MKSELLLDLLNNSSRGLVDSIRRKARTGMPSDLKLVLLFTALALAFVYIPPLDRSAGRIILGIPVVLFIPGYVLIAALFPGKDDLDHIERVALGFGLSIAIVPLIGLALNFTPWGIRLTPVIISLTIFILILVLIAHFRRLKLPESMRFEVNFRDLAGSIKTEIGKPEKRIDKILTVVLIISIVTSLLMVIYVVVTPKQGEKFTEFYLLGPRGKAEGYPTDLSVGRSNAVIVGIVNHEYETVNFTIRVKINEEILEEEQIRIDNNQTWEKPVNFTPGRAGSGLKLQFLLYKGKNFTQPYRDTHLWVNVTG